MVPASVPPPRTNPVHAMDPVTLLPETHLPQPRLQILPRLATADDDSPPFFVHFSRDGRTIILHTPDTLESYTTSPQPAN